MSLEIDEIRHWVTYGCGDNSCEIVRPTGMATNGGCRCFVRSGVRRQKAMANAIKVLLDRLDALE